MFTESGIKTPISSESSPTHLLALNICESRFAVVQHFQNRPHFTIRFVSHHAAKFDVLVAEIRNEVVWAVGDATGNSGGDDVCYKNFLLRSDAHTLILVEGNSIEIHADSHEATKKWCRRVQTIFAGEHGQNSQVHFLLLQEDTMGDASSMAVPIDAGLEMSASELERHYGSGFSVWEDAFIGTLNSRSQGATLLRGGPGVGKTSFIRHLICKMRATHAFYFLPTQMQSWMTSANLLEFWLKEKANHSRRRVLVIEDAEALIADRVTTNRDAVSDILNISDGLMGDFLDTHLLFTVNCRVDQIEPALVREGRLTSFRDFRRLSPAEAEDLAAAKEIELQPQPDYSLAEIYNPPTQFPKAAAKDPVGFGIQG